MTRQNKREKEGKEHGPAMRGKQDGAGTGEKAAEIAARLGKFARSSQMNTPMSQEKVQRVENEQWVNSPLDMYASSPGGVEEQEERGESAAGMEDKEGDSKEQSAQEPAEPTITDVFKAVTNCSSALISLNTQMGSLQENMSFIRQDLRKVTERMKEVEDRVSCLEDKMVLMRKELGAVAQDVSYLLNKADDLENRLCRNNLRLVGVPEKVEGINAAVFFEQWLIEKFGKESLSNMFAIERAHRVPFRSPPPGAPPRPILIKLLHFKDRDAILRRARDHEDLSINGRKVLIFPDFSAEVQKKRAKYGEVKRRLRERQLQYSMIYPSKLRVVAEGKVHFFDTANAAAQWLEEMNLPKNSEQSAG